MLVLSLGLLLHPVWADDEPSPPPSPDGDAEELPTDDPPEEDTPEVPDIAALEARIAALEATQQAAALEDLLRDAEAAAAEAPAPVPPAQVGPGAFNPALTAFGDGFWSVGFDGDGVAPESGPWMRSLELDLRAGVDPYAQAVAVLALHQDPPLGGAHAHDTVDTHATEDTHAEDPDDDTPLEAQAEDLGWEVAVEELYVDFVALPGGLTARAGLFKLPFGVVNRQHPHDLPWTQAPLAFRELLGPEGLSDTGVSLTWRPRWQAPVTLTLQGAAVAGETFHAAGITPGWLGRGELFADLGAVDVSAGASATGRESDAVFGGDLMVRWKGSSWRSVLLLAEALATTEGSRGGYAALQVQPTRPLYLGLRLDAVDGELGGEAAASWYTSEFLRLRLSLAREEAAWLAQGQLTFVWGSHPVEPYWVNR